MQPSTLLFAAFLGLGAAPAMAQSVAPLVLSGVIESADASAIVLRPDGAVVAQRLVLASNVQVIRTSPATLADIRPDDFIASAAVRGMDGKLHSTELRIFPAAMRGVGEGQRPMNDPRNQTMTNATVTGTAVVGGSNNLKVKFAGGESELVLDPDVPVTRMDVADRGALVPGVHVRAQGTRGPDDGYANITRITLQ